MKKQLWKTVFVFLALCLVLTGCQSAAAKRADEMIAAIGTVSLESKGAIEAAEAAVKALSEKEVSTLVYADTLTKARAEYEDLYAIDKAASAIDAIGTVGKNSASKIARARTAFDALDTELQSRVSNADALTAAEDAYGTLVCANAVKAIDAIGTVTLESGSAIAAAQKEYTAVSEKNADYVRYVTNAQALTAAEETYTRLRVENATACIAAIGTVTVDSKPLIDAAAAAYNLLTDAEKAGVRNAADLPKAQQAYTEASLNRVRTLIAAIGTVTLESKAAIDEANSRYNALSSSEKKQIENYDVLKAAKTELAALEKAEKEKQLLAEARSLIRVTKLETSRPDSAGGVSVYFNFENKSDKVIKYVNFGFTLYNAVGDTAPCEIAGRSYFRCYSTGPFAKGEGLSGYGWYYGKYYNYDIKYAELDSLDIEYMDGTTYTFNSAQIEYVQY